MQLRNLLSLGPAIGRLSLQAKTTALLVAMCLVMVGLDAVSQWLERSGDIAHRRNDTANLARSIARHAQDTILAVDGVLAGLVERLEVDGTDAAALDRVTRVFRARMAVLPQLDGVAASDADGNFIVTSRPTPQTVNVADRDYFQFQRNHQDGGPFLGVPVQSRVTGHWIIPVSRRYNHADGSFAGVVLATIDVTYFQRYYQSFEIGRQGSIILAADDGTLLARQPFDEAVIGKRLFDDLRDREAVAGPVASDAIQSSPVDGRLRLFARRPVESYPLFVYATAGMDEVLADWREDLSNHLIGGSILISIIGLLGLGLVGQGRSRQHAEAELRTSEARYRLLAEHSSDAIMRIGLDGTRHYVSPAVRRILGRAPEELLAGGAFGELVHPDDRRAVVEALAAARTGAPGATVIQFRWRHQDGRHVWIEAVSSLVNDEKTGTPLEVISTLRDVSKRKQAEAALVAAERRLADAIASISDAFVLFDRDDRLLLANQKYVNLYPDLVGVLTPGATYEAIVRAAVRHSARVLASDDTEWHVREALDWHRRASDVVEYQLKDGRWIMGSERRTSDGSTVGIRTDISARKAAELALEETNRRLELLAKEDGLTGLANRRYLDELLDQEFQRARRDAVILSLVMIDVDLFKKFNDRYGHLAGDECLKAVASAVQGALHRPGDVAARYGGEEFAVLLPNTPDEGALIVAEQIRQAVRALQITHEDSPPGIVTISLGVSALCPVRDLHRPEDLLLAADRALYAAKAGGRDRVCSATEPSYDNIRSLRR